MSCSETHTVEALHDGRLPPEQAEVLRLHLVTCAVCSNEVERLELLSSTLTALPEPDLSKERVDAGRRRLLDSARRLGERPSPSVGRMAAFALAACAALLGWFGLERAKLRPHEPVAVRAVASAANELILTVTPAAGTTWSRASSDLAETLALSDGELAIEVRRHGAARRLLMTLPDGELEDVGTVFSVEVHAGKTRAVTVNEGRVALRLRGQSELLLSAGESFHAPDDGVARAPNATPPSTRPSNATPSNATPSNATPSSATPPSATPASTNETAASGAHPPAPPRDSRPASAREEACPNATLFQDGVQAFKRGEYGTAATLLERFSAACGRGNHGEDAAYLRMVALARAGRHAEARAQAAAYLSAFPNGFRHKEAEKLVEAR